MDLKVTKMLTPEQRLVWQRLVKESPRALGIGLPGGLPNQWLHDEQKLISIWCVFDLNRDHYLTMMCIRIHLLDALP